MSVLGTVKRNIRPVLVMGVPLALMVLSSLGDVFTSLSDSSPGATVSGLELSRHAARSIFAMSSTIAIGLAGLILTILDHNDKMTDALGRMTDYFQRLALSDVRKLDNDHIALNEMAHRIENAKKQIYLMYLRAEPSHGEDARQYWKKMTESLLRIRAAIPVRRVATIDTLKKLEYLLGNNKELFDGGGVGLGTLDYQLVVYPSVALKPLQWDIVDDALFLFTPYANKPMLLVTDKDVVDNYVGHFSTMLERLRGCTLISTSGKSAPSGRQKCGYSREELGNILRTLKYILHADASALAPLFHRNIQGYCEDIQCDEKWFLREFERIEPWPDLIGTDLHAA